MARDGSVAIRCSGDDRPLRTGAASPRTRSSAIAASARLLAMVMVLLVAILSPASGTETSALPRKVVAHYMVCCPLYGHGQTVDQFEAEFRAAKAQQIDGFALNCGAWNKEPHYKDIAARMFEAADRLGGEFKLFFSADVATGLTADEAANMVATFHRRPSYFQVDGRPALTSFHGSREWTGDVVGKLREAGIAPFVFANYVRPPGAGFFISGAEIETPSEGSVRNLVAAMGDLDGYFYFGAGGTPANISASSRSFGRLLGQAGKSFMAPVTPYYKGLGRNNRMFDSAGFAGMVEQWKAAIDSRADFVQIVTWNDWSEASYLQPFGGTTTHTPSAGQWGTVPAHDGFLAASQYYISWFKTGVPPKLNGTRLYYAYQLHPRDCGPAESRPRGWMALADRVYAMVATDMPLSLNISVGGNSEKIDVAPGLTLASAAMNGGGEVRFEVVTGTGRLYARGALPIVSDGRDCGYNYFAGEAELRREPQ